MSIKLQLKVTLAEIYIDNLKQLNNENNWIVFHKVLTKINDFKNNKFLITFFQFVLVSKDAIEKF